MLKTLKYLVVPFALSAPVAAQEIPADLLEVDRQRIMKDCVPGFGEAVCTALSDCTVAEFKKRLQMDSYLKLSMQLSRSEVDAENRALLDDIAKVCTQKLEQSGIELPAPTAPEAAPKPAG